MSRTMTMEVYSINELSEEAKQRAFEDYCKEDFYPGGDDNTSTLEAFEKIFPIKVKEWSYGGYNDFITFNFEDNFDYDIENLYGIRLMKYLWNNYGSLIFQGKYFSHGKYIDGKYFYKSRYSKIILNTDMVLTGYYLDDCILNPIYNFLNHPSDNTTFYSLLNECLYNWIKACTEDYEDYYTMERFIENSKANNWEYFSNGEII